MHRTADKDKTASPPNPVFGDFAIGGAIAALSIAASFLIGVRLLGNPFYVEWLIVSIMGFLLLIAWLLYLRDDTFMRRRVEKPAEGPPPTSKKARRALIAASAFLALSSLVLYFGFGLGASL
jgi:hypothetical protein